MTRTFPWVHSTASTPTILGGKWDSGYFVTNGPTFSPDGRKLYHADSLRRVIL